MTTSKLLPRRPGFYLFRGTRKVRDQLYSHLNEPVKIIDYPVTAPTDLAVLLCGLSTRYRLDTFSGEWTPIDTEAA